ncbi:MAG: 6-carboxytetrahydropterin synthase [Desulfotignum balticum]|jgi:6-pyruvoyltetrahydropterin/6-carboxytetrahydropterin synthase|uniref:6-carboxy-5,6,7,8-tetrahydropterin synthase n=1 Tax=Desulfotignum balticum TaxID=115781 RepID=A0A931CYI6_9BACT|nr:6-carboxytetrahydropterin synthase [Desulfotignum balticum]
MLTITREFRFDAAHRLFLNGLTDRENRDIFGQCSKLHGHTYRLRVTVSGRVHPNGMILDFTDLKQIVDEKIIARYDHAFLNEWDEYRDQPTTVENMCLHIFKVLSPCFEALGAVLTRVQVCETPDAWATVTPDV